MEFLNRLYSNEYFGIGLFIVISVLALLFLIILFFGKKDEKKRLELERLNLETEDKTKPKEEEELTTLEPIVLHKEEQEQKQEKEIEPLTMNQEENIETLEEIKETPKEEFDPFVTSNLVLNTDYIVPEEESIPNKTEENTYNFDSIINQEEEPEIDESIDEVLNKYDAIEESLKREENIEPLTPIIEEEKTEPIFTPKEPKREAPFSSVYLEQEKTKLEEPKPKFELPKRANLEKKDIDTTIMNDQILSSLQNHKEE